MSRIDHGFRGEQCEPLEAFLEGAGVAAGEVGSADAGAKEGIAAKKNAVVFVVEADGAGAVSGQVEDGQLGGGVAVADKAGGARQVAPEAVYEGGIAGAGCGEAVVMALAGVAS